MIPALTAKAAKAPPSISQAPREPGRAPLDGRDRRRRAPTIAKRRTLSITPLSSLRRLRLTGARLRRCDRASAPLNQEGNRYAERRAGRPLPSRRRSHPTRSRNVAKGLRGLRGGVYTNTLFIRKPAARVLYRLPGTPRCGRVIRQAYHVWGISDAGILFSQRTGGGGAAARGTTRERAGLPAGC